MENLLDYEKKCIVYKSQIKELEEINSNIKQDFDESEREIEILKNDNRENFNYKENLMKNEIELNRLKDKLISKDNFIDELNKTNNLSVKAYIDENVLLKVYLMNFIKIGKNKWIQ